MGRIVIDTDRLRLEIDPALGAGITDLSLRRSGVLRPLMRRTPAAPSGFNELACYLLVPWSNRIARARFSWRGREHRLRADWPDGTAIHGLVKDRPWRIIERTPVAAMLQFESRDHPDLMFPWPFGATVRYELSDQSLSTRLTVRHSASSGEPMPAGLGFHPFFPRTLWDPRDRVSVRYPSRGRYPTASMIPTAPARPDEITEQLATGRPLESLALDDVFLGSASGATITWPASGVRLTNTCSTSLAHAVVYTGEPGSFCFEPVTMVNDGFNLVSHDWSDTGVAELGPGQSLTADWSLRVDTL